LSQSIVRERRGEESGKEMDENGGEERKGSVRYL
jgi:hypothetical protein